MFGLRLKELRGSRTQDDIAAKLDITRARYSHYENERSHPDPEMLVKMATVHKTTVDYILGLSNERFPYDYKKDVSLSEEDRKFIADLLSLPSDQRAAVRAVTAAFKKDNSL